MRAELLKTWAYGASLLFIVMVASVFFNSDGLDVTLTYSGIGWLLSLIVIAYTIKLKREDCLKLTLISIIGIDSIIGGLLFKNGKFTTLYLLLIVFWAIVSLTILQMTILYKREGRLYKTFKENYTLEDSDLQVLVDLSLDKKFEDWVVNEPKEEVYNWLKNNNEDCLKIASGNYLMKDLEELRKKGV